MWIQVNSFILLKDKYIVGDEETRRRNYFCDRSFVSLETIPTWAVQSTKFPLKEGSQKKFQADPEINSKISLWQGDITLLEIGVIVNAANKRLAGGGGGNDF